MDIILNSLNYKFDNDGNTVSIAVSFQGSGSNFDNLNATLNLTSADLSDGKTFDDLSKKDIVSVGRNKLAKLTAVTTDSTSTTA
ncbi:hypothetical protein [Liquorilactobacillus uvarum]|uniref:hypothetical protein n=1 Tax=Liquorilactobacillus uvarum TaxID=303240 RepID=UPI00288C024F|nr:hypothetical protein [Liquorilactobacillus uvarum]